MKLQGTSRKSWFRSFRLKLKRSASRPNRNGSKPNRNGKRRNRNGNEPIGLRRSYSDCEMTNARDESQMTTTVVGIDVGGTFTDIAVLRDGVLSVHKLPSTPADPSVGITAGVRDTGVDVGAADFIHGSTVATNALLEGKGGRTALVTTMGFEDVLEIGRQNRADLYDLSMERPEPLAPWQLRFGLPERIDYTGTILDDLTPESIDALVELLGETEVDGVAVSFLFSFLNPAHEEILAQRLAQLPSRPFISISSRILPEFREYERTSTVVVNSYVGPVMARYLTQLESALGHGLRIMQSSGGSITASLAADQPVRTILSGPAGGVVGAFYTGIQAGYPDIITLDMGGTSTDVSLCPGRIKETTSANLGGYPVSVPMIEIHTVGAGGGSIARVDAGGALVVGPQSAGADPGPGLLRYGRPDHGHRRQLDAGPPALGWFPGRAHDAGPGTFRKP